MKAAFTPLDPLVESLESATETLFSVCTPSQPPFSVDEVLDTQRSKPSDHIDMGILCISHTLSDRA